jgi:hypothetical protein
MVTEDCAKAEVAAKAANATRVIALFYLMSVSLFQ